MKSLFDIQERWTFDANNLAAEMSSAIVPIFKKYIELGYSVRQISHLCQMVIQDEETSKVLDINGPWSNLNK